MIVNESLCSIPDELQLGFYIFQISPFIVSPIYISAVYLLVYHSGIHARRIRIIYLRNMVFNILCMITISIVLCPIFYLPMIGYQANGLIRFIDINLALPAIFTVYTLLGVAVSIMHLFHYRLKAIATMHNTARNLKVLKNLQRLVHLTYLFLVCTCLSYLVLLTIQSLQPTIKPLMFEKYHIPEVWCPQYLVADPFSWQIYTAISTTICFILGVISVVLVCGAFTFAILVSARKDLSQHTLRVQKTFTAVLIVQAVVHVIFILVPIVCIVVTVYFDIWVEDGGLFFFLVEAQQGTASTLVFIFTHSVTKKILKRIENRGNTSLSQTARPRSFLEHVASVEDGSAEQQKCSLGVSKVSRRMKVWTVEALGRNTDRLIKKYEHVPTVISLVTVSIAIFMFVAPVLLGH